MTSTSVRPSGFKQPSRDPGTAAMLSIIPGLGQLYNGESRKGFLFLAVAAINLAIFLGIVFTDNILQSLLDFSQSFHMKPNSMLVHVMQDGHFGHPVSWIMIGFF